MPEYFYTAKSIGGEIKTGVLSVKDRTELSRVLHQEGYFLISANLEGQETKKRKFSISLPSFGGVSLSEKMFFTKNLGVMVAAGISLPRAIRVLSSQAKSKKLKNALTDITEEITKGRSFSDSLKKYPSIFPELFQSMIKVGEETGTLEDVLKTLAQQIEKENELRSKIKGAMLYPTVILVAMLGIGILMLITVVPQLAKTFEELQIQLPLTTRMVISVGNFLAQRWFFALLIAVALFFFFRFILRTKTGKRAMDRIVLELPIVAPIVKKTNSAQTVRGLSSLISSGVPIVRALEVISGTLGNSYFRDAISNAVEKVRKGGKLSESLRPYENLYPSIVIQMAEVGEETGESAEVLKKLADFFEEEVANATKNLSAIIEPVLMLIIGAAIGFFAISMIQPMYSMLGAL